MALGMFVNICEFVPPFSEKFSKFFSFSVAPCYLHVFTIKPGTSLSIRQVVHFLSMSLSLSESPMPSENTFKQHVELTRTALKTFTAIRQLDAPGPIKTAFDELVVLTADFTNFVPFFVTHPLFIELPPLVFSAFEDFLCKNPAFEKPAAYAKVVALNARIKESASAAKKGESP